MGNRFPVGAKGHADAADQRHPRNHMPAFLIADVRIINREKYNDYRLKFRACVARHGGRFLARGQEPEIILGGWHPPRMLLVEFASGQAAQAMMDSQEYHELELVRANCAMFDIVIVEGAAASTFARAGAAPAFAIADARIVNQGAFDVYRASLDAAVGSSGGRFLAQTDDIRTVAGNWAPSFIAILEFPDRSSAAAAWAVPAYQAARDAASNAAMIDMVLLTGAGADAPD